MYMQFSEILPSPPLQFISTFWQEDVWSWQDLFAGYLYAMHYWIDNLACCCLRCSPVDRSPDEGRAHLKSIIKACAVSTPESNMGLENMSVLLLGFCRLFFTSMANFPLNLLCCTSFPASPSSPIAFRATYPGSQLLSPLVLLTLMNKIKSVRCPMSLLFFVSLELFDKAELLKHPRIERTVIYAIWPWQLSSLFFLKEEMLFWWCIAVYGSVFHFRELILLFLLFIKSPHISRKNWRRLSSLHQTEAPISRYILRSIGACGAEHIADVWCAFLIR